MWNSEGPDRDHHPPNFYQNGLARDCLLYIFGKSETRGQTLSGICWTVKVLRGSIFFQLSPAWFGKGLAWRPFQNKWGHEENLSRICWKVLVLTGAIIFQTFTNMVWQGIALGTMLVEVRPGKNLIRNVLESDGPNKDNHFPNFH